MSPTATSARSAAIAGASPSGRKEPQAFNCGRVVHDAPQRCMSSMQFSGSNTRGEFVLNLGLAALVAEGSGGIAL
jgi:hypothetical protein